MIDCSKCNAYCCKAAMRLEWFKKEYDRGDGVCKHLTDDNRCEIYANRPEVCNTDLMYEKYFASKMTREEYDELNTKCCERLSKEKL